MKNIKSFINLILILLLISWCSNMLERFSVKPYDYVNKKIPQFNLKEIKGLKSFFSNKNLKKNNVLILHFFAPWCPPCNNEHPEILKISKNKKNIMLYGVSVKSDIKETKKWLDNHGNPYDFVGIDTKGELSQKLDENSLPMMIIVDKKTKARLITRGEISFKIYKEAIEPFIKDLNEEEI